VFTSQQTSPLTVTYFADIRAAYARDKVLFLGHLSTLKSLRIFIFVEIDLKFEIGHRNHSSVSTI
jgi:hypothetical protein